MMGKHIRMRFFADWESERTSPNRTPRECFLQITNLVVFKIPDFLQIGMSSGVFIGVKILSGGSTNLKSSDVSLTDKWQKRMNRLMSGSKKDFLRSNEIPLTSEGFKNIPLDLSFLIIYSHKLKGGGSKLAVMIQKKNRLRKKKPTRGSVYETLASGEIDLSTAFQRKSRNFELDLTTDKREGNPNEALIARVHVSGLTVQPTDTWRNRPSLIWNVKREEEELGYVRKGMDGEGGMENGEGGKTAIFSEPVMIIPSQDRLKRKNSRVTRRGTPLSKKFLSFWKRLRRDDTKLYRETMTKKLSQIRMGLREVKEELKIDGFVPWDQASGGGRSDSGTELDTCSVSSNPRPSLRPYFSNDSLLEIDKPSTPSHSNTLSNDPLKRHRFGKRLICKRLMKTMSPTRNLSSYQPSAP